MKGTRDHTEYFNEDVVTTSLTSLSLSLSYLSLSLSLCLSLSVSLSLCLSLSVSLSLSHTHTHIISISNTHSLTSPLQTVPRQNHRWEITDTKSPIRETENTETKCLTINWKKFGIRWDWTQDLSVQKRVYCPLGHADSTKFDGKIVSFLRSR